MSDFNWQVAYEGLDIIAGLRLATMHRLRRIAEHRRQRLIEARVSDGIGWPSAFRCRNCHHWTDQAALAPDGWCRNDSHPAWHHYGCVNFKQAGGDGDVGSAGDRRSVCDRGDT